MATDIEKPATVQYVDEFHKNATSLSMSSDTAILSEFTKEEERRIVHRVDRRLVTVVGLIYCISVNCLSQHLQDMYWLTV
jgi:hypothetical protein